ncbi:hypothetical protein LC612_31605 [Nostoc sp. CHAB 5834]|nr:hypothetical protein [Nostoc sp. CHAB 5834]
MINHSFHDEISLAEKTEDLARKAMKLGLISSFVVHHFPDSWVFYIPDQNTSPTLTPEEAYLKLKKIVESVESSSSAE